MPPPLASYRPAPLLIQEGKLAGQPYDEVFTTSHHNYVRRLRGMHESELYRGRVGTLKLGLQAVLAYVKFRELHAASVRHVSEDTHDVWETAEGVRTRRVERIGGSMVP